MKSILIAAGMAAMLLGVAPASAAPVAPTPGIVAPQDGRWNNGDRDRRDDRRMDNRRGDRDWRGNRGWRGNDRRGWNNRRCQNVRRHHRWVRVCR